METRYYTVTGSKETFKTEKEALERAKALSKYTLSRVFIIGHFEIEKGKKQYFEVGYFYNGKQTLIKDAKIYPELWDGIWEGK